MNDPKVPGGRTDRGITPTGRQVVLETEDRPVTQILQDIFNNVQEIIRSEMRLARTEIGEETNKAVRAFAILGSGLILAMYAVGFLLLSAVYALAAVLPDWLGPLLVGLVVAVIATALIVIGRNRVKTISPVPQKTIASVKEDAQWVKDQTK
ncbi:MAG: phage holin family protein [Acidobacteria bacterium]|nr:MAG: phage holin family protein [Acidobacteriota bacterium]